ncbi:MAG: DUF6781 family protein [Campylobacterota bacterium]|nr:DUF6781 family protein [Campylobacterota bacterium]
MNLDKLEDLNKPSLEEMKTVVASILDTQTKILKDEIEELLLQKEYIERSLEKKSQELQDTKCNIFNMIEAKLTDDETLLKLHQIKLQSIDLYDFLSELVESAIITALEKDQDGDISDTIEEVIKDITFEAIKEGSLNTLRVRKILSIILASAIGIAEATPTKATEILTATLKGMRSGLIRSIARFKKRLAFMPVEAKHILIEDYETIMEDLNQTDTLFSHVVTTQADENSDEIKKILLAINKDMRYDLEELVHISKETAQAMKARFSTFAKSAVQKADTAMKSSTAKEAKRMGKQALGVARVALGSAMKSAKDVMDTK